MGPNNNSQSVVATDQSGTANNAPITEAEMRGLILDKLGTRLNEPEGSPYKNFFEPRGTEALDFTLPQKEIIAVDLNKFYGEDRPDGKPVFEKKNPKIIIW